MTKLDIIITWIWLFINYFIILPLLVQSTIQYYRSRFDNFIYARRPNILLVSCYIIIYGNAIHFPFILLYSLYFSPNLDSIYDFTNTFLLIIFEIFFVSCMVRGWLLFFDYGYNQAISKHIWVDVINPDSRNTNFFIRYRSTLGNSRIISTVFAVFVCLGLSVISVPGVIANSFIRTIVFGIFLLFSLAPFGVIGYKLAQSNDYILVKREFLNTILIASFSIIDVVIIALSPKTYLFNVFHNVVLATLCYNMICLVSTRWVLYNSKLLKQRLALIDKDISSSDTIIITNPDGNNYSRLFYIKLLLKNQKGLELFMQHLIKEYSTENLLFLIECTQFIAHILNHLNEKDCKDLVYEKLEFESLPESYILKTNSTLITQYNLIYEKYISERSSWMVNVSFPTKETLFSLYREFKRFLSLRLSSGGAFTNKKRESLFNNNNNNNTPSINLELELELGNSNNSSNDDNNNNDNVNNTINNNDNGSVNHSNDKNNNSNKNNNNYNHHDKNHNNDLYFSGCEKSPFVIIEGLKLAIHDTYVNLTDSYSRFAHSNEWTAWYKSLPNSK